jgi:hypothetical protein
MIQLVIATHSLPSSTLFRNVRRFGIRRQAVATLTSGELQAIAHLGQLVILLGHSVGFGNRLRNKKYVSKYLIRFLPSNQAD